MQRPVKHHHAVTHVVEGHAQLRLALADFVEEPCIFYRDHRLRSEVLKQRDLFVGKGANLTTMDIDDTEQRPFLT